MNKRERSTLTILRLVSTRIIKKSHRNSVDLSHFNYVFADHFQGHHFAMRSDSCAEQVQRIIFNMDHLDSVIKSFTDSCHYATGRVLHATDAITLFYFLKVSFFKLIENKGMIFWPVVRRCLAQCVVSLWVVLFASANQKHYPDLGSEHHQYGICAGVPHTSCSQGNQLVALRNVGYFLRPRVGV